MLNLKAKSATVNSGNPSVAIASVAMLWCHRIHLYFVLRGSSAQAWHSCATSAVSSRLLLSDREQKCWITNGNGPHSRNIGFVERSSFLSELPAIIAPSKNKTLKLTKVLSESDVYFTCSRSTSDGPSPSHTVYLIQVNSQ